MTENYYKKINKNNELETDKNINKKHKKNETTRFFKIKNYTKINKYIKISTNENKAIIVPNIANLFLKMYAYSHTSFIIVAFLRLISSCSVCNSFATLIL